MAVGNVQTVGGGHSTRRLPSSSIRGERVRSLGGPCPGWNTSCRRTRGKVWGVRPAGTCGLVRAGGRAGRVDGGGRAAGSVGGSRACGGMCRGAAGRLVGRADGGAVQALGRGSLRADGLVTDVGASGRVTDAGVVRAAALGAAGGHVVDGGGHRAAPVGGRGRARGHGLAGDVLPRCPGRRPNPATGSTAPGDESVMEHDPELFKATSTYMWSGPPASRGRGEEGRDGTRTRALQSHPRHLGGLWPTGVSRNKEGGA